MLRSPIEFLRGSKWWWCVYRDGSALEFVFRIRARFLSPTRIKHRLCLANNRAGYFSNLACDWLSIVWTYSKIQISKIQESEYGPWSRFRITDEQPSCNFYHKAYHWMRKAALICKNEVLRNILGAHSNQAKWWNVFIISDHTPSMTLLKPTICWLSWFNVRPLSRYVHERPVCNTVRSIKNHSIPNPMHLGFVILARILACIKSYQIN